LRFVWHKLLFAWHARGVARRVRRRGWTAIRVGEYRDPPCWNYSIGFWESVAAPEIVLFDVPYGSAAAIFEAIHRDLASGELVIEDGREWGEDGTHKAIWRRVHPTRLDESWFTLAQWYKWRRTGDPYLIAFQLVLADSQGRYPWHAEYESGLRRLQPELYLPRPPRGLEHARAEAGASS
jgi:hypothetical protein